MLERFGLLLLILASLVVPSLEAKDADRLSQGQELAFNRKKGNCLSCHMIKGGDLVGNIAPPLIAMSQRYPHKKALRQQIWDASSKNIHTVMPPFGKNLLLTEKEIDILVDYIHQL